MLTLQLLLLFEPVDNFLYPWPAQRWRLCSDSAMADRTIVKTDLRIFAVVTLPRGPFERIVKRLSGTHLTPIIHASNRQDSNARIIRQS